MERYLLSTTQKQKEKVYIFYKIQLFFYTSIYKYCSLKHTQDINQIVKEVFILYWGELF